MFDMLGNGMAKKILTSPDGQKMIREFISSPEGMNMIKDLMGTAEGKKMLGGIMLGFVDQLSIPDETKTILRQALQEL